MNQIKSKVYYEIATGTILTITSEMEGTVEATTKDQDMNIYTELQGRNINDVDFIELEYGTLGTMFKDVKSYKVNLESKSLECEHFTAEELEARQAQVQESQDLNNRVNDISTYLSDQSKDTISTFENYIMQTEINKITEGMN